MAARKKTKTKPKKSTRKTRRDDRIRLAVALLFLLGFLIFSLVILANLQKAWRPHPAPKTPPKPSVSIQVPEKPALWNNLRGTVEEVLQKNGIVLEEIHRDQQTSFERWLLPRFLPADQISRELATAISQHMPQAVVEQGPFPGEISVSFNGRRRLLLQFPPAPGRRKTQPRIVIIMDDLGGNLAMAKALLELNLPVTMAILPNTSHPTETARLAHAKGREVMVHMPMEPQSYPAVNPGRDALFVNLDDQEINSRLDHFFTKVPYAVGGNNHMGSLFTEYRQGMDVVLTEMKKRGLFFVDSMTTGNSVGYQEARRLGVPTLVRDVFLDNVRDVDKISQQLQKVVKLAHKKGHAVAICHPHPQTLTALKRFAKDLNREGVQAVSVETLLREQR